MTQLETLVEPNEDLAQWLGVDEVVLVREDLLPDDGGKKRRALEEFASTLSGVEHIHLLSYAGSHTAFTLSQLLPEVVIHLYGTHYGGGAYEAAMVNRLNAQINIVQSIGSVFDMTRKFNRLGRIPIPGHHFMKIGGHLGSDPNTSAAVNAVINASGSDFHHFVAVASGDLLNNIYLQTQAVTGVLTQPLAIRLFKSLTLPHARGISATSLGHRISIMREIHKLTGNLWDPIFMGSVFSYLKRKKRLPRKICIWVTCPTGIEW